MVEMSPRVLCTFVHYHVSSGLYFHWTHTGTIPDALKMCLRGRRCRHSKIYIFYAIFIAYLAHMRLSGLVLRWGVGGTLEIWHNKY